MKVIVCGAGSVGVNIISYLSSQEHEVTVVDNNTDVIREIGREFDIRAIEGMAAHPNVLEDAGAKDADLIIAVTSSDEVNLMVCYMAYKAFRIPMRIARVKSSAYAHSQYSDVFNEDNVFSDSLVYPEVETSKAIVRALSLEWATEVVPFAEETIRFIGMPCTEKMPFTGIRVKQVGMLFPNLHIRIVTLLRAGKVIYPKPDDKMMPGDEVYFTIPTREMRRAMIDMGLELNHDKSMLVIGAGRVGRNLLREIDGLKIFKNIKVVEKDKEKAEHIAEELDDIPVICGDIFQGDIQDEASFDSTDTVIALMGQDESNVIASLLAKNKGVRRTIAMIDNQVYENITGALGIDMLVDPNAAIVSNILRRVRKGKINKAYSLKGEIGELIEGVVMENSKLVDMQVSDLEGREEIAVAALVRDGEPVYIKDDTEIEAGDTVVVFLESEKSKDVEKLFSVRTDFF